LNQNISFIDLIHFIISIIELRNTVISSLNKNYFTDDIKKKFSQNEIKKYDISNKDTNKDSNNKQIGIDDIQDFEEVIGNDSGKTDYKKYYNLIYNKNYNRFDEKDDIILYNDKNYKDKEKNFDNFFFIPKNSIIDYTQKSIFDIGNGMLQEEKKIKDVINQGKNNIKYNILNI